jgi:hypothetical protein
LLTCRTTVAATAAAADEANTTARSVTLNSWLVATARLLDTSDLFNAPNNAAVRRVGPATIDAEPVTMYRADTASGSTTVYVDARNRTRRVLMDQTSAGKRVSLIVDVTQWGQPVRIDVPQPAVEFSALPQ